MPLPNMGPPVVLASIELRGEEKVRRVDTPSMDRLRSYQARSVVVSFAAHQQGIAVCKIRRNFVVITDRSIRAFFSQPHTVAVVFEPMWKQTGSYILAARNNCKQHCPLLEGIISSILQTLDCTSKWVRLWKNVHRSCA